MPAADILSELELLVRSRHGLIVLDTVEEERAEALVEALAGRLGMPLFRWSLTKGLRRAGLEQGIYNTTDLGKALEHVELARIPGLFQFQGLSARLDDAVIATRVTDVARQFAQRDGALITAAAGLRLPPVLAPYAATVQLPAPGREDYRVLLRRVTQEVQAVQPVQVELDSNDEERLLSALHGLSLTEAERTVKRAILYDGRLTKDDVPRVLDAKREIVQRDGVLEFHAPAERMQDIAGLDGLKTWLGKRKAILRDPEAAARFGLEFPKGILLVGVPGCGKSLCAKAVAAEWGLPLLKLDPSNLYDKYIGESERNFRKAMQTAEKMSPAVLWIDEIEKAFSGTDGGDDSGVSARILGTFLSWMQDRQGDVFIVATANDIAKLRPEFVRKGRFDEIFFIDLPTVDARCAIFHLHLARRGQNTAGFDLRALAEASDGFSGAEIEQVIQAGLFNAFNAHKHLDSVALLAEIRSTVPLSRTMADRFSALRQWAAGKTVNAA